jgi:hypothetical protein
VVAVLRSAPSYARPIWPRPSGSSKIRLPVALKTALATAAATGGTPSSPTPVAELKVKGAVWTRPALRAEVNYRGLATTGELRRESFKGLRDE